MIIYTKKELEKYLENDWILDLMKAESNSFQEVRTNKWLEEIDAKRMIYADVYGDILRGEQTGKVLDVGGGINVLTKKLADNCQYTLLDFLAHGGNECLEAESTIHWINEDWYETTFAHKEYDIIIANDIFPDVDQRMQIFIEKALEACKELRLVITYYNNPQFYLTKRTDDSELMTFLSWDGEITALKLEKYLEQGAFTRELERMKTEKESIYRNGRQVAYVKINGKK
ncbi:MAG: class I SAM-dependent methyltransferase [Lachnospiraceae bacterium]|nr:class I SAM-dependent methyltransferase [Lachnospiraceae bacterium]